MKGWYKILPGLLLLILVGIGSVYFFNRTFADVTEEFLSSLKENNIDQAYTLFSPDFRAIASKQDLQDFINVNSLQNYQQSSWGTRFIESDHGEISGTIITEDGRTIPLVVGFIKGEEGWKIHSMRKPSAGLNETSRDAQIPPKKELIKLLKQSIHQFALSVNEKSMAAFHQTIANVWQQQLSVADLDKAFSGFFAAGLDLTILDSIDPEFKASTELDENRVLVISGAYTTRPRQLHFDQKFIYEGLGWKLVGFNATVK